MRANAVANRERILSAAGEVFGRLGAAGSTEEVAARAGVGIATVFRHFPTKAELIEAALLRHFEELATTVADRVDAPDAERALVDTVETMIKTGATKLTLASLLPDGTFPPSVREASDRVRAMMRQLVARAAREGGVRDDVTVDEIYLLVRALAQTAAVSSPPPATLDAAIAVVLDGLRGERRRERR